jgi:Flp pilus assembly protein TadB
MTQIGRRLPQKDPIRRGLLGPHRQLIDSQADLSKTVFRPMTSERQKREQEIERLMRGAGLNPESDVAFQEQVRKAASTIIQEEENRIQNNERAERVKRPISPVMAGLWLVVLGATAFAFSVPTVAGVLFVCGIAVIVWATVLKSAKK